MSQVEVLMSTYNGNKFIETQMESIISQSLSTHITVRDDGSTDNTRDIIAKYDCVSVIVGENIGATESFFELIQIAPENDYYAFSDQDDRWDINKLEVAIDELKEYSNIPAIYSGNTRLVDKELKFIRDEKLCPLTTLGSAIVKNYATGCTVVFNKRLMHELKKYRPINVPYHDWWTNLLCLSVGGISIYDVHPHMDYRQHENNVVSGNDNSIKKWSSRLKRFNNPYRRDLMAEQILNVYRDEISDKNKEILNSVIAGKNNKELSTGIFVDDFLYNFCRVTKRI